MPEHESWCCRSPLSPCAQEGGCSGSCNCGADESIEDDGADPSLGELRVSSANLMAASFLAASVFSQAARAATDRQEFIVRAVTAGVAREDAERIAGEILEGQLSGCLPLDFSAYRQSLNRIYSDSGGASNA